VISYRASLDVPRDTALRLAGWLAEHRRALGTRRGRRALGCFAQAVLVLRWFRDRTDVAALAPQPAALEVRSRTIRPRSPTASPALETAGDGQELARRRGFGGPLGTAKPVTTNAPASLRPQDGRSAQTVRGLSQRAGRFVRRDDR
jgi:hypothetical protein